jgi:hypothetical protein
MLAFSTQSAAGIERQLREQIATLQHNQKQLVQERDQSQVAAAELAQLRNQLNSAQDEIARLAQSRVQAQLKGPAYRLPLNGGHPLHVCRRTAFPKQPPSGACRQLRHRRQCVQRKQCSRNRQAVWTPKRRAS